MAVPAATTSSKPQLSNNNYIIVLVLISLLVVGGSVLVGNAMLGTLLRDAKVVVAKDKANKQLDKDVTAAPVLVSNYNQLGSRQKLIMDALPTDADFPGLLGYMEGMSGVAGMSLKLIGPSATVAPSTADTSGGTAKPQMYSFNMNLEGNYASLVKLLGLIEQSARPMRVTDIQVTGTASSLSAIMDVTTWYQDKATLPITTEEIK